MKNCHPNPFFLAELDTPHFKFRCVAESEKQAHDRMSAAWNTHRRQTGATGTWAEWRDSMNITEIEIGEVYRDYEPLTYRPKLMKRGSSLIRA